MVDSNEILDLVRSRIRQLPKRTAQEELMRQQEFIRNARVNGVFETDLTDAEMSKLANTTTSTTGWDGRATATQLINETLIRITELPIPITCGEAHAALFGGACFGGLCQPHRPEVLRKTVDSRVVEPLALPEPETAED